MGSYTYGSLEITFDRELTESELKDYIDRVKNYKPEQSDNGYWFDDFDPEHWNINPEELYDEGESLAISTNGIDISIQGAKAYDFDATMKRLLELMPNNIWIWPQQEGFFETEGEHWGVQVRRREFRVSDVTMTLPEWPDDNLVVKAQELAYMKGGDN